MFVLLHNVCFNLHLINGPEGTAFSAYSSEEMFDALVRTFTWRLNEPLLGGYWFIRELFIVCIISWLLLKYVRINKWIIFSSVVFVTITIALIQEVYPKSWLQYINRVSVFIMFFILGHLLRKYWFNLYNISTTVLCAIVLSVGGLLLPMIIPIPELLHKFLYIICAPAGAILTFNLSNYIFSHLDIIRSTLIFIGTNTLKVLTWHFLYFKLVSLIIIGINGWSIERLAEFPVLNSGSQFMWIPYTIVGLLPIAVAYAIEKGKLKFRNRKTASQQD